MNSISQLHLPTPPPTLRFTLRPPFPSKPISSLPLTTPSSQSLNLLCVKASTFTKPPTKPQFHKIIIRNSSLAIASAALLFANFTHRVLPATATASPYLYPPPPSPTVENYVEQGDDYDAEKERSLEAYVVSNPDDVKGLKALMECKVRGEKIEEGVELIGRLICIEPDNIEWRLLRANLYSFSEKFELAKAAFEEVLEKDSLCFEAYHGIVMAMSKLSTGERDWFKEMLKRIEVALDRCEKNDHKKEDVRDFKLLLAQVKVFEGYYSDALKVYQDLALEEPMDFRPYLCQGIIYTVLKREEEAKVEFEKYRKLVPEGHPYDQYLKESMLGPKG